MKGEKLVEVWNYPRISLAEVGKYRLAQNGIYSEIFGGKVDSYYLTAIGGVSLMVKGEDFDSAKEILNSSDEVEQEAFLEKDEIFEGSLYCSRCHSKNIRTKKIRNIQSHFFLVNVFKKWCGYKQVFSCRNCKNIWKVK